jgi:adenine-specific DNA-methyltransferase
MAKIEITKTELVWPGKYDEEGNVVELPRVGLPFQVIETVNESRATRETQKHRPLSLFDVYEGREGDTFEAGWKNKLIWGDNLLVMTSLLQKFAGKIDLIYIDPPFAAGLDFSFETQVGETGESILKEHSVIEEKAYRDTWGMGTTSYLSMMWQRLRLMYQLLSPTGSIYVHCDWHMNGGLRMLLDEVFGADRFINEIVWKRSDAKGDASQGSRHLPRVHDSILLYSKAANPTWQTLFVPLDEHYVDNFYKYKDAEGRRYKLENMLGPGGARKGNPVYEVMGVTRPWRYSRERMKALIDAGLVIQTSPGTVPMQKKYLEDSGGRQVSTWWDDISMLRVSVR